MLVSISWVLYHINKDYYTNNDYYLQVLNKYITTHFTGEIAQTACAQADELTDTEICDMDETSSVDFDSSNIG